MENYSIYSLPKPCRYRDILWFLTDRKSIKRTKCHNIFNLTFIPSVLPHYILKTLQIVLWTCFTSFDIITRYYASSFVVFVCCESLLKYLGLKKTPVSIILIPLQKKGRRGIHLALFRALFKRNKMSECCVWQVNTRVGNEIKRDLFYFCVDGFIIYISQFWM